MTFSELQVGEGGERKVFFDPERPDKLRKELKEDRPESAERAKARFYLTKIIHELYPENIPDFHQATSTPNTIIVERKQLDEGHLAQEKYRMIMFGDKNAGPLTPELAKKTSAFNNKLVRDPKFYKLVNSISELGVNFDAQSPNFGYDEHGNLLYVDSFQPWVKNENTGKLIKGYDVEKLRGQIARFNEPAKQKLLNYLQRLEDLFAQEEMNLPPNSEAVN